MVKTIETKAIVSAQDQTGAVFAQVARKLKDMERAAETAGRRTASAVKMPAHAADQAYQVAMRSRAIAQTIQTGAAAAASSAVVHRIVNQASNRLHEELRMQTSGMKMNEIHDALDRSIKLARDYKPVGQTEILHMLRNTRSVVGAYHEAVEMIRPLLDLRVVAQHANPNASKEQINEDTDKLVKAAELSGVTLHPEKFKSYIDGIAKAINVFGDTIKPYQFFEAAQYGRAATMGLSPGFVAGVLPTMIQHHGGAQAGTAIAAAYSAIVGGKMSNQAVQQLYKLGLLDESKIVKTKTGNVKGVQPGGIRGADLFRTDPDKWFNQFLGPALISHGITDPTRVAEILARVFSNRVATQFATEMITQKPLYDKDRALTQGALGARESAKLIMDKDYGQAVHGLTNQIDALAAAAGRPFLGPLTQGINLLGDAVGRVTQHIDKDKPAAVLGTIGAIGAAGLGAAGLGGATLAAGGALWGGLGWGGAARAAGFAATSTFPAWAWGAGILGGAYLGYHAGQGVHNAFDYVAHGKGWSTSDAAELSELRGEVANLEKQIAAMRGRQFDKSAFNPVVDQQERELAELKNRVAHSAARHLMEKVMPFRIAPGLSSQGFGSFGMMPDDTVLNKWSSKKQRASARPASLDDALPWRKNMPGREVPQVEKKESGPQNVNVDVHAHADPITGKIDVNVNASSQLIAIVDSMKSLAVEAKMAIHAAGQASGPGSKGSTDSGLPQQH